MRNYTRWTEDSLVSRIEELYSEGVDLRTSKIQQTKHRKVYRAACSRFKDWRKALSRAGIKYEQLEAAVREKRKQQLLLDIKQAYDAGVKLNSNSIKANKQYSRLYWGATSFYKGRMFWEKALYDAGIDPDDVVIQRRWDKGRVKRGLKIRDIRGKLLNEAAVKEDEPRLYKAAIHHFDCYDDALTYAGYDPKEIRKRRPELSEGEITGNIIAYWHAGADMRMKSILDGDDDDFRCLMYAAERRYGGWYGALEFCGIDPEKYREHQTWNKDKVEIEIIRLYEEGEPLNAGHANENHRPLYKAAYRYYGSWENAIVACGLDYDDVSKGGISLTVDDITEGIKLLAEAGHALNAASVLEDEDTNTRRLYRQSLRKFENGWDGALEAAGLDASDIRLMRKPYTLEELGIKFKRMHRRKMGLRPKDLRKTENYKYYLAAMERFDSWFEFLDAIGIDSSQYIDRMDWDNGNAVLETMKEMFPAGLVTGLRTRDRNLSQAALSYFNGTENAVREAGLVYSKSGRISEKMLDENPEIAGKLLRYNRSLVMSIAELVYYRCRGLDLPTMRGRRLVSQAFISFRNSLPEKPPKKDLRRHIYEYVSSDLIETNRRHFEEAYSGNEEKYNELKSAMSLN